MSGSRRAVRQRRLAADVAGAVMRVRLQRLDLDVDRQHVRIGDRVALSPGGMSMLCRPSRSIAGVRVGGGVAEVEADRRLDRFGLAARLHVHLDDEIRVALERHARSFGSSGATCPGVHPRKWPSG